MQRIVEEAVDASTIGRIYDLFENVSPQAREYISRHKLTLGHFQNAPAQ